MELLTRREAIKQGLAYTAGLGTLLNSCSICCPKGSKVRYKTIPAEPDKFVLGVNYWPRKKAMHWWKEFDEEEAGKELTQIKEELNLDLIRIFLLWEDFQPEPSKINKDSMDNLETVLKTADNLNLKVIVTFFTGHMSGINWAPEWSLEGLRIGYPFDTVSNGKKTSKGIKDMYTDELMIKAELFQLEQVISKAKHHSSIYAWDLGNENSIFLMPRSYDSARNWTRLMHDKIKTIDKEHPVTLGTYMGSLTMYTGFRISDMAAANDFLSMHGYLENSELEKGNLDSDLVPFCSMLTRSLGKKPVLFEEFGMPTKSSTAKLEDKYEKILIKEENAGQYYKEVLEKLHNVGSIGAVAWCYSDYDQSIWNKPPLDTAQHERFFGLTRADGSVKPAGQAMREFAKKRPTVKPAITITSLPKTWYGTYGLNAKSNFDCLYESFKQQTGLQ